MRGAVTPASGASADVNGGAGSVAGAGHTHSETASGISGMDRPVAPEAQATGVASLAGGARSAGHDTRAERTIEAKSLCDRASDALDGGDFAHAQELATASLKLRRSTRGYLLRARAENRLGRVDAALRSLDAATELAPNLAAIWEQRGRILWAARRRDEARAAFARFLDLAPNSPSAPEVQRMLNEQP